MAFLAIICASVNGFMAVPKPAGSRLVLAMNAPPAVSDPSEVADVAIPTILPSEKNIDYVPLATMLATGQLAEADQVSVDCFDHPCGYACARS
jgi:hypothetical protein